MKQGFVAALIFFLAWPVSPAARAATIADAKKEAEAKGYTFITNRDEILAKAKKEGRVRVLSSLDPDSFKPMVESFKKKYPSIDIRIDDLTGTEAYQRFLLELKAGTAKDFDTAEASSDFYNESATHALKFDILGMAEHGVLIINPKMVDPNYRNMVSVATTACAIAYNKDRLPPEKVPQKWEDFLKPEFKGNKFVLDLRPFVVAGLVPAWGLERTLDFARKLAAQQPVWGRTASRVNTAVAAGENSLYIGSNFSAVKNSMSKDPTGNLNYRMIEPVPTRIIDLSSGILNTADHPHTALLFLEFLASPEGQEILDKYQPLGASVFTSGSVTEQVTRGKKLSVVDWDHFTKFQEYNEKIFAAYGLPKADK